MEHSATLISAIASLLWPLLGFVVLGMYHAELRDLLRRIRRGKFLGQEIELQEELVALNKTANEAVQAVLPAPATPLVDARSESSPAEQSARRASDESDAAFQQVLHEVTRSPKAGVVLLASEIERSLRHLLVNLGLVPPGKLVTVRQAFDILAAKEVVPRSLVDAVREFNQARNRLVHGFAAGEAELLSAIDSGLLILRAISAIPHATHVVDDPAAALFRDADGKIPFNEAVGLVMINEEKPGAGKKTRSVFPTTRRDYQKGQMVAWQWNLTRVFPECWYRDAETGQIRYGWTASGEFVGAPIE